VSPVSWKWKANGDDDDDDGTMFGAKRIYATGDQKTKTANVCSILLLDLSVHVYMILRA